MIPHGCVLGNSHAACLRAAWAGTAEQRVTLEFVAAHAERLDGLEIGRGRAVARTAELRQTLKRLGMRHAFRLEEFDFFVITACQVSMFRAVHATREMVVWPEEADGRMLVSAPCFREVLADSMRDTTACRLATALRTETDRPILVLPQPRPHEVVLTPASRFAGFRKVAGDGRGPWLSGVFQAATESAFAGLAVVLHQPRQTVAGDLATASPWSEGSIMLAAGQREHAADDVLHANADYGALQLSQIAAALAA